MEPETSVEMTHEPGLETAESLRRALDVSPGALMIADSRGKIVHANKAAKDILGVAPESLIGAKVDEMPVRLATMEGTAIAPHENPMARAMRERREIVNEDLEVITPLGELKFLLVSVVPLLDEHGCLAGALSSFVDITDRKRSQMALEESERRLRLMLENMTDIVFLLDTQSNVIYVSPSVEKHTGWRPEELMGIGPMTSGMEKLVHPDDKEKLLSLWVRSMKGESHSDVEFRGLTKDGRVIWFSATWSPVMDKDGRLIAVQGSVRDITDRVLSREARMRVAEEKRNFYKATIEAFTGGRLEIIDPEDVAELTHNAEASIEVITPEDAVKAREMVKEICDRHNLPEEDKERFVMAVGEAITNAIKHGQGGRVQAGFDGEDVWVSVTDRGPGIETLAIPKVTLQRGYSSKISLGMGYSMILDMADKTWLSTGPEGTTVILTCCASTKPAEALLESLADTW